MQICLDEIKIGHLKNYRWELSQSMAGRKDEEKRKRRDRTNHGHIRGWDGNGVPSRRGVPRACVSCFRHETELWGFRDVCFTGSASRPGTNAGETVMRVGKPRFSAVFPKTLSVQLFCFSFFPFVLFEGRIL